MKTILTSRQIECTKELLQLIYEYQKNPNTVITITYGNLNGITKMHISDQAVEKEVGEVSRLCHKLGLPMISALVVNKATGISGHGFYTFMAQLRGEDIENVNKKELHKRELDAIKKCENWHILEDYLS